ncbi:proline-rich protein 20G [Cavia porcellus]|uniref:proline-rich protein 20G n=1 Tax=Cavia porcellus TaxID=10141 RepID=UPI000184C10E
MEKERPLKPPCTVAPDQASNGDPRGPDHHDMEPEDPREADGPSKSGQPVIPIAFVNPMRCDAPVHTEPARPAERSHLLRRPQQAERAHTPRQSQWAERHSHLEMGYWEHLEHSQEPDTYGQVDVHGELGHPEARWTPPFSMAAPTVHEDRVPGHISLSNQQVGAIQDPPPVSGYWAIMGQQISAIYPCIGFIPLPGSSLRFIETSFGTHVFGFPVFFTNIAR